MEKIKAKLTFWIESDKGRDILTIGIIILVGLGAFELGRLSVISSGGIKIEYPDQTEPQSGGQVANVLTAIPREYDANVAQSEASAGKAFFASSRGKKYYSLGCSAGNTIKPANRIYFATEGEAQDAGYEASSSCN